MHNARYRTLSPDCEEPEPDHGAQACGLIVLAVAFNLGAIVGFLAGWLL